jgi:hypothetical protein
MTEQDRFHERLARNRRALVLGNNNGQLFGASMAGSFEKRCDYCPRMITMRQMLDGNGRWLPFEGRKQHFCWGQKAKMRLFRRNANLVLGAGVSSSDFF